MKSLTWEIASSPVIQHAIRRSDGAGGISISASHNTEEWNALRFFGPKGTYLSTAEANELLGHLSPAQIPFG
jgi:phosphomannomutase